VFLSGSTWMLSLIRSSVFGPSAWVRYEEALDRETNQMVRRPIAAYVEQVCRYGNFDLLGI